LKVKSSIILGCSILFLLAGLLTSFFLSRPFSAQSRADRLSERIAGILTEIERDVNTTIEDFQQSSNRDLTARDGYALFVYGRDGVISWSDNKFVPTPTSVADTFEIKLLKAGNGDYLARKWTINPAQSLVAIIPLYRKYNISNNYLDTWWNEDIFPTGNISILEPNSSLGLPVCVSGHCPFRISFHQGELLIYPYAMLLAVILYALAILLMTLFVYRTAQRFRLPALGLLCLFGCLFAARLLMIKLGFPNVVYEADLFNPLFFASSTLNASLGDLLLNILVVFVCCYFLFTNHHRFKILQYFHRTQLLSWTSSVFSGLCILFGILFPYVTIQTIYNNSAIVLDISQSLDFSLIRVVAIGVALLSGVCSFLFTHTFIRLMIADGNRVRIVGSFILAMALFALINGMTEQRYLSSLVLGAIYFLVVYFLRLYAGLKRLTFATFSYLFIAIFFLSANGAYAIHFHSSQEKINRLFRFADNFLVDRDVFGEYLLHETALRIAGDAFIQTRIHTPFLNRDAIRQKIRQVFLPTYFNKYDVEIYLFGSAGEPLNNRTPATLSEFVETYEQDAFRTPTEDVYFITSPSRDVTQKYLVKIPISRSGSTVGYIMLELSLKKIIPENVYPELLVDNSFQQFYHKQEISYAVFSSTGMLFSSGKFNYDLLFEYEWLGDPDLHRRGISANGYLHIAQEDENDRVAVVSSQDISRTHALANFSFLLVLGLAIILKFLLAQGIVNYAGGQKLYFAARIQLLLNLAFVLPLILVSVTTLNLTNRSSQNQLNEEYLNKAESFGDQLATPLADYLDGRGEGATAFENQLTDLAKLTRLDANVYRAAGELIATSQPQIFENNLVSTYVNPDALRKIRRGENLTIETEQVGTLSFFVSYAALKDPLTGDRIGILGIPFFQSAHLLEKVQINIIANILNIFALILIALVSLSYFVSMWLTFPLTFITQSLQRTSLTKINEPLNWKSDDEIGLMVKEYNQMLFKLSESKAELEQTQRERTWREIAQQVAHEIKNPLTPMKLTLQQLQRSVQTEHNSRDKTEKAVSSLLSQVETLNDIALSFSTFAKLPEPVIQRLEIVALVKRIVLLHSQSGELTFVPGVREAYVFGDEQLLGRTFSNIILNAFQAAIPGRQLHVRVSLEKRPASYVLVFQDNGKGIEPEIAERIFLSHFSTKKSGSGLGLAIAKQAIIQMEGQIWFETEVGRGTSFFVELPASE
jgi:signal transduction histidine kinase